MTIQLNALQKSEEEILSFHILADRNKRVSNVKGARKKPYFLYTIRVSKEWKFGGTAGRDVKITCLPGIYLS
jgi:hypothetical protein